MNTLVQAASTLSRTWVRVYTARLPEAQREGRRAEVEADLWDHREDGRIQRTPAMVTAMEIVLRTFLGVFDDLGWRLDVLRASGRAASHRRVSMLTFNSRHTRWMGLAGLAGGLLWAMQFFFLLQGQRIDRPVLWGVGLPALIAALLLAGLAGFLRSYRGLLGRRGTIGVWLLITCMAAYFFANTLLGVVPAGAVRNGLGVVLAICFTILPVPGFILIGLSLKGRARTGAFLVAIVGPLSAFLPMLLSQFVPIPSRWLSGPVSLGYFIYFVLVSAWLAAAGYSTYRQAQRSASPGH